MNIFVYPYHALPRYPAPLDVDNVEQMAEAARLSSLLLYFDSVTLAIPGTVDDLLLDQLTSGRIILEPRKSLSEMTLREFADANYYYYRHGFAAFVKQYAPLWKSGLIKIQSLAEITAGARSEAEKAGSADANTLTMLTPLMGYLVAAPEIQPRFADEEGLSLVNRAYGTTDGPGLITFFIAEMLERGDQRDLLDGTGMPAKIDLIREATLIDAFFQSLISELLSLPSVSFQEDHLALRAAFLSHIKRDDTVGPEEKSRADVVRLAMQCFEQTEIALPAVIPRHPEQILELRQKLKGDLDEFREKLKGLAKELADTKPETSIRDIKRCVEKNLIDEVKKLDKKLAKPLRELRREFFAMAPGMAGIGLGVGILLSALLLDGHAALQTLSGMSSTLLSALGALGAAASKVQTEKQRKIEGSDVAFLIRAKDDIQKA